MRIAFLFLKHDNSGIREGNEHLDEYVMYTKWFLVIRFQF